MYFEAPDSRGGSRGSEGDEHPRDGRGLSTQGAKQRDREEIQRTGVAFDDRDNGVRLDATSEEKFEESLSTMMEKWSQEKKTKLAMALGRCTQGDGTNDEAASNAAFQSLHGMTSTEVFAKAEKTPVDGDKK